MFKTQNQLDFAQELKQLTTDQGHAFSSGYFETMLTEMLAFVPKRKQKEFITQLNQFNGKQMVEVTNLMTGKTVLQRRDTPYACDVSKESFWSS